MGEILTSLRLFVWGVLKRVYLWAPSVLVGPIDWYDKFVKPMLPTSLQLEVTLPTDLFPYLLGIGLLAAAVITYHEERVPSVTKKHLDHLAELRKEAIDDLLNERVNFVEVWQEWKPAYDNWCKKVGDYLEENLSRAERLEFDHNVEEVPVSTEFRNFHVWHRDLRNNLIVKLDTLKSIIERQSA